MTRKKNSDGGGGQEETKDEAPPPPPPPPPIPAAPGAGWSSKMRGVPRRDRVPSYQRFHA